MPVVFIIIVIIIACVALSGGGAPSVPEISDNHYSTKDFESYSKEDIKELRIRLMSEYNKMK